MTFAEQRYLYLNTIMEQIDTLRHSDTERLKHTQIETSEDLLTQISILEHENQLRCESDYLTYVLRKIRIIYDTPITSQSNAEIVSKYRTAVMPLVTEIYESLQTLSCDELKHERLTKVCFKGPTQYIFTKLCEFVFGDGSLVPITGDYFQEVLGDTVDLSTYDGYDELYVLILAGCFAQKSL